MVKKNNKTVFSGIFIVIGYVFNKAISFLMIPILTRILTSGDYGKVSTYLAWVSLLAYIIGMALEYSVRNAYVDYKEDMDKYMSSLCALSLVGAIGIGLIVFLGNKYFAHQLNDILCFCCIIHAYVHALINYMNMKYTMYEQYVKRVAVLVLPNLISAIVGIILILNMTEHKYMGRIWGFILIYVPLGVILLINQFRRGKTFCDVKYWKYALFISIPMVFHGLSNVLMTNFDRILLSWIRTDSETGIYSLVYNFSMIAIAITTAIENIWIPWFTKHMQSKDEMKINKYVKVYIYVVVIIICGILMVSPEVLMLMSSSEYWSGKIIIAPLVLSSFMIFLYSLHVAVEIYYKASKYTAFNTFIAAMFNIVMDMIFIPRFGMVGAAYTTLASYILSFTMHYRYSRKLNKTLYPFKIYIVPLSIIVIMTVLSYIFLNIWIVRWMIAIALGISLLIAFIKKEYIIAKLEH